MEHLVHLWKISATQSHKLVLYISLDAISAAKVIRPLAIDFFCGFWIEKSSKKMNDRYFFV